MSDQARLPADPYDDVPHGIWQGRRQGRQGRRQGRRLAQGIHRCPRCHNPFRPSRSHSVCDICLELIIAKLRRRTLAVIESRR